MAPSEQSSSSTSNSRIPAAFLIFVAMVVATEIVLLSFRLSIIPEWYQHHTLKDELMERPYDYVIIGDSYTLTAVDPRLLGEGFVNLSYTATQPVTDYFILKRYLENGHRPKVVFINVSPSLWSDHEFFKYDTLGYFLRIPEYISLLPHLRLDETIRFLRRFWVSLDQRDQIKHLLSEPLSRNGNEDPWLIVSREIILDDRGFVPIRGQGSERFSDEEIQQAEAERFAVYQRNLSYWDRFVQLARGNETELVFYEKIIPDEIYRIRNRTGFNEQYARFKARLKAKYPDVYFAQTTLHSFPNRYFADYTHLTEKGAEAFTLHFRGTVVEPYLERSGGFTSLTGAATLTPLLGGLEVGALNAP